MTVKVNIVDAICGVGKTSSAINHINKSDGKFLYITPYLTEVRRIKTQCATKNFKEPERYGTKLNGIRHLFNGGNNIVSTHSLFSAFNEEIMDLVKFGDYTLIMDEVADVVEPLRITQSDLNNILDKHATIEGNNLVWTDREYTGEYEKYKNLCDLGCISIYSNGDVKIVLLWMFPVEVFKAFKEVYILTYLFDAQIQKYYYDYYGVEYTHLYVKDFQLVKEPQEYMEDRYKKLINIYEGDNLNDIGKDSGLSKSWFIRNNKNKIIEQLKKNTYNYFTNITKTKSSQNMWTTFKDYEPQLSGKGYAKGFVSLNMRATNDYRHKENVAYLANRYMNPIVKNFFIKNNVEVNEDLYALSELLQFIFRSKLRDEGNINLYLPSERMRTILKNW